MNKNLLSLVIVVAVVALGFGIYTGQKATSKNTKYIKDMQVATVLPDARAIANFKLTDNQGKVFDNASLKGHWTLFFFGFTHCPHICPTTMAELKQTFSLLKEKNIKEPQVVLVSIDPKRDTVKRLNSYVKGFNPDFRGATGSEQEIKDLTKNLGIVYMKVMQKKNKNNKNYDIDHSGSVLLIDPQGNLKALFSMPHKAQQMAHDFTLIQKYNS